MLVAMPSGETPVSNSSVCERSPRRTVTSAENPCSASRPGDVAPPSNSGAATGGARPIAVRRAGPMSAIRPS